MLLDAFLVSQSLVPICQNNRGALHFDRILLVFKGMGVKLVKGGETFVDCGDKRPTESLHMSTCLLDWRSVYP